MREALATYTHPHVLVIDEVGYLTYATDAANVLFHVVTERHLKKRPMIVEDVRRRVRVKSRALDVEGGNPRHGARALVDRHEPPEVAGPPLEDRRPNLRHASLAAEVARRVLVARAPELDDALFVLDDGPCNATGYTAGPDAHVYILGSTTSDPGR